MNTDHTYFVQTIYYVIFGTKTNKSMSSYSRSTGQKYHYSTTASWRCDLYIQISNRNIHKLYGVILKQTSCHWICSRQDEIWMVGSMGNVDLNVKLKWAHWALCKQSYKAKHHTWWIRASGKWVNQTNGQGLFNPESDSICIENGGKCDGYCARIQTRRTKACVKVIVR